MKTDREFLDGVYVKAEKLRTGDQSAQSFQFTGKEARWKLVRELVVTAAACIALLLTGGVIFENSQPRMEIPEGYTNLLENIPMTLDGFDSRSLVNPVEDANLIAAGKVSRISDSVYEEAKQSILTMVTVNLTEIYRGEAGTKQIDVAVTGGVNQENRTYLDYEAVFRRGENVLLLLSEQEDGTYILFGGAMGKLTRLKGKGREATYAYSSGEQVTLEELLN